MKQKSEKDYKTFDSFLRSLYGHCLNCGKRERNLFAPQCCKEPQINVCIDVKYLLHWHNELCTKRKVGYSCFETAYGQIAYERDRKLNERLKKLLSCEEGRRLYEEWKKTLKKDTVMAERL